MTAKKDRKFWRDYIAKIIKDGAVKIGLSWLVKRFAILATGPLNWLASLVVIEIWDFFGDKLVRWALRKNALIYDTVDGNIKAVKIKKSRGRNDSTYDSSVDDVFD